MWTSFRGRLSTSFSLSSPSHHQYSFAQHRRSIFFRSVSKEHSREEDYPIEEVDPQNRSTECPQQSRVGRKGKMKWRTASERQRNLERHFGTRQFHCGGKFRDSLLHTLYWGFRRFHYWLCFYVEDIEIDIEDLLANPFSSQPPSLDELQRLTGFRREWIMFLYRNFKQLCSNGRMTQTQWRAVFRLIFKGASDYEFADRAFAAIAGGRSQRVLTFEDLILCLHDLVHSYPHQLSESQLNGSATLSVSEKRMEDEVPATNNAQFTLQLMLPDQDGRVDEHRFLRYTICIFKLSAHSCGSGYDKSTSGEAATFGMIGGSCGWSDGSSASNNNNPNRRASIRSSSGKNRKRSTNRGAISVVNRMPSWLVKFSKQQFKLLDSDNDGFITVADLEKLFHQKSPAFETLILHTESQLELNDVACD